MTRSTSSTRWSSIAMQASLVWSIATYVLETSSRRQGRTEMADKRITIQATRYDPDKDERPRLQSYEIPFSDDSMVVLDALNYIKSEVDGSLSYRWSCLRRSPSQGATTWTRETRD